MLTQTKTIIINQYREFIQQVFFFFYNLLQNLSTLFIQVPLQQ
jgi:hypothetical protein